MEMALSVGKLLTLVVVAGLFWLLPEKTAIISSFFLGGILTLLYFLFVPDPHKFNIKLNNGK